MKPLSFCDLFRPLVALLLVGLLVGCDSRSESDTFTVTLMDEDGAPVYAGELRLSIEAPGPADEPGEVTGSWRLEGVGDVPDPNPASGLVVGSTSEGFIQIGLDMNASDSGIGLAGTYDGDRMEGSWNTITIAGPMPRGAFVAERD